jgi:hypothetical protein
MEAVTSPEHPVADLRHLLDEPGPIVRNVLWTAGIIYLPFACAVLPIAITKKFADNAIWTYLGITALPIWGGAILVLLLLGAVYLIGNLLRLGRRSADELEKKARKPVRSDWDCDL